MLSTTFIAAALALVGSTSASPVPGAAVAALAQRQGPHGGWRAHGDVLPSGGAGAPPAAASGMPSNSSSSSNSTTSAVNVVAAVTSASAAAAADPTSTAAGTTAAAAATTSSSAATSTSSGEEETGGYATYFYQGGNAGACGTVNPDSAMIVAVPYAWWATSDSQASSRCGQQVQITAPSTGQTITATVADLCPSCQSDNSLDLSVGAMSALAGSTDYTQEGQYAITWSWL